MGIDWTPSWRGSPFEVGFRYRVVTAVSSHLPDESLVEGEQVVYKQSGYSRYDCCSVYEFVSDTGVRRTWWLHDDEPIDSWRRVFVAIGNAVTTDRILEQVRRILWEDWDPIGVNDELDAFGEYDSYAPAVVGQLIHGATAADIDFYLSRIETDDMGLGSRPSSARASAVARIMPLRQSQ